MSLVDFLWVFACGGWCGWIVKDLVTRREERARLRDEHSFGMHERVSRSACPPCREER